MCPNKLFLKNFGETCKSEIFPNYRKKLTSQYPPSSNGQKIQTLKGRGKLILGVLEKVGRSKNFLFMG